MNKPKLVEDIFLVRKLPKYPAVSIKDYPIPHPPTPKMLSKLTSYVLMT